MLPFMFSWLELQHVNESGMCWGVIRRPPPFLDERIARSPTDGRIKIVQHL